ncbi:MAG: peptidyl-prolyl cis-trans isomerase [Spirochaetes bacterium]|nr:peptidyl-prolyl cis-trans isomerase [Spirochaetota bacterium]MBN2772343.1 peptidyl-prolyl cis-trans isomerase [Spirochaetota bacterium]
MRYKIIFKIILLGIVFSALSCSKNNEENSIKNKEKKILMNGEIVITLDSEKAPLSAENFISYVNDGFFDGTIFHRVIPGFVVQGGGFTQEMDQKKTKDPVKNEADNGLSNVRGSVAMARTQIVDSATSQFYINLKDNVMLDHKGKDDQNYGYCVFGHITSGMEFVDKIAGVKTGNSGFHRDVPEIPVVIKSAVLGDDGKTVTFTIEQATE